ncbi:PREDICTED: 26S proteasome non-ATPase regulatory subunit 5 isoform X2 [Wasmannia auropunctata]|uniref:26S proteasome non-ATPase regulatory subunit 5 isoform X2 n=1 Tax=Wasmannia auropunctata TaxID=64793 RepID=UPI0005EE5BB3|nr:PREDICTED: 26S proteasome non-ATPase regulatory subunit 5 isoform X2 [Wasmannia auropunctata]
MPSERTVSEPTMTWYQAKIQRLCESNNIEDKKNILKDVEIKFAALRDGDEELVARSLDLRPLLAQLTSNDDREFVELLCQFLLVLFQKLEPGEFYQRYPVEVSALITNPNASVRYLVLHNFERTAKDPVKILQLIADTTLLISIVNRIGDNDLNVAKCAMSAVKKIGKNPSGLHILYKGELLRTFAKLLQDDTVSFRVYEVIVDIATTSQEALEVTAQSGFLNSLINILENDDVLLQLNALELLTQLAVSGEGLSYLEQQEVLVKLVQKIAQVNENPLSNLVLPGLMKFFGSIACHWPNEMFSKYPVIVIALFDVIDSGDESLLGPALDTLGFVSESVEGKYALEAVGDDAMLGALKKIAEIVQRMPTDLRIRGLSSLYRILRVERHEQDNRILSLTKLWFDSLCDDPLGMIVAICRQPFADIRQGGLAVLGAISSQVWGQEYISTYPGLVEFLLDRNVESFKECKHEKYQIVKCLSQAERDIFDADTMQKFKQFVNEGPYFVDVNAEVAIEGES